MLKTRFSVSEGFSYLRYLSANNRVIGGDHSMGSERGKAVGMLVSTILGGQVALVLNH